MSAEYVFNLYMCDPTRDRDLGVLRQEEPCRMILGSAPGILRGMQGWTGMREGPRCIGMKTA